MWKQWALGLAVSGAAVFLFLKAAPPGQMLEALAGINYWWLIPCLVIYAVSFIIRALRWHYLMRPVGRVGVRPLLAALMVGFLGNNILPAHLGEIVRAMVVGRETGVSSSATFATVVLERVYDGLTVLFFLLLVLLFMDLPPAREGGYLSMETLRTAGWWGLALFAGLMAVLQAFRWQKARCLLLLGKACKPLPPVLSGKILDGASAFSEGLAVARPADLVMVGFLSLLVWFSLAVWAWTLFFAFGLHMSFWAGILMEVVVSLALLIPSAPAFIGTFHLAAAATISFMGADAGVAGSYAMVLWLVHFVITTLAGLYYLWSMKLGIGAALGRMDKAPRAGTEGE